MEGTARTLVGTSGPWALELSVALQASAAMMLMDGLEGLTAQDWGALTVTS